MKKKRIGPKRSGGAILAVWSLDESILNQEVSSREPTRVEREVSFLKGEFSSFPTSPPPIRGEILLDPDARQD